MGFVLISSVSAIDINEASTSSDLSDSGISSNLAISSEGNYATQSSIVDNSNASSSNVNSESEVLSTNIDEDSLDSDTVEKNSKNQLSSSSLQASTKTKTTLKGSGSSIYRGNPYNVTLTDSNGKVLANQKLTFNILGKNYTRTTNSKGVASMNINLAKGKYTITCLYDGSSSYASSKLSTSLTVSIMSTKISAGTTVKKGNDYSVTLTDANGKALANQTVSFNILGKSYNRTTNSKGVASMTINLAPKKYSLVISYPGSANYLSSKASISLTVSKGDTSIKSSGSSIVKGKTYSFTLVDGKGKAIANQKVTINVLGKSYSRTTDSKGVASITINLAAGKKYSIVCSYAGSSNYKASSSSVTLSVTNPSSNTKSFSIANIEAAANSLKAYVIKNKALPSTVSVGGTNLKISEFSYLMSKAIVNLNSNNKNSIALLSGISNGASSSNSLNATVYKAQYVDLAKRVYTYIDSNKAPAAYGAVRSSSGSSLGNAGFNLYTFAFAKILDFHKTNGYLPNYCTFESSVLKASSSGGSNSSSSNSSSSNSSSSNSSSSNSSTVTQKATTLNASSISIIRGDDYSVPLTDSSGKVLANQKIIFSISGSSYNRTTNSKGIASFTINLVAGKYSVTASYAGSSAYKSSKLTKTVTVSNSSSRFFLSDIETASENLKAYVIKNKVLPNTVTVAGNKLTLAQFTYVMAKAIKNINAGKSSYISLLSVSAGNSSGDYLDITVYKAQYLNLTDRVISYMESNKAPAKFATVYGTNGKSVGKAEYKLYSFAFAKILAFYKTEKYLPSYCTFQSSAIGVVPDVSTNVTINSKINASTSQFKVGLNEKNTVSNLSAYLVGTGQSAITPAIQNVANQLTKGLNSTATKALAIYNYVRDEISYSYYADSRKGADGTLSSGSANCCDQANLVVALCRASGIPARYSHAQGCTFSSGLVTGHVWAQILVDGVWYSADATSVRNSLGNIVNWNTNSYRDMKQYTAIPF